MPSLATFRHDALDGAMVASRRLPYVYVQNWKCGCSTVKHTLWAAEHTRGLAVAPDYPHKAVEGGPFVSDPKRWENLGREFVFTVVRNPYTRVLSAYLNQVVRHRNPDTWGRFAARHGLGEDHLGFGDFLRLLTQTPVAEMDPHWRPQHASVAPSLVPYDFVGALETMDRDLRHVLARVFGEGAAVQSYAPHQTGSSSALQEHFGPSELALAQAVYERDFASLGYSMNPGRLGRVATMPRADDGPLRSWGRANRLMEAGQFGAAAAELEALRAVVAGPAIDDRLLRCHQALARRDADDARRMAVIRVVAGMAPAGGDADLWKQYGRTLKALGRREEGLEAQLRALAMRKPHPGQQRRLRRRRLQLALLRASKGRRRDALATLPRPAASLVQRAGRGALAVLASLAAAAGARYWHPDRPSGRNSKSR